MKKLWGIVPDCLCMLVSTGDAEPFVVVVAFHLPHRDFFIKHRSHAIFCSILNQPSLQNSQDAPKRLPRSADSYSFYHPDEVGSLHFLASSTGTALVLQLFDMAEPHNLLQWRVIWPQRFQSPLARYTASTNTSIGMKVCLLELWTSSATMQAMNSSSSRETPCCSPPSQTKPSTSRTASSYSTRPTSLKNSWPLSSSESAISMSFSSRSMQPCAFRRALLSSFTPAIFLLERPSFNTSNTTSALLSPPSRSHYLTHFRPPTSSSIWHQVEHISSCAMTELSPELIPETTKTMKQDLTNLVLRLASMVTIPQVGVEIHLTRTS